MKLAWILALAAATTGSAALVGCHTSSPDAPVEQSLAATATEDCTAYARAYCGRMLECLPGNFPSRFEDRTACEDARAKICALEHSAPGAAVPPTDLAPCVKATEAQSCAAFLTRTVPDACGVRGTLALGAACGNDTQCATGFCAAPREGCGTCANAPARGERCIKGRCGPRDTCGGPFNPYCLPRVELGEPCGSDAQAICRYGLVCVGYPEGRCEPGLPEGSSCQAGASDGDPMCDATRGLRCNGFAPGARCVKPRLVAIGESCGFNDYSTPEGLMFDPSACRSAGFCPLGTSMSACQPRSAEGEPCDAANPDACMGDLACIDGTCGYVDPARCGR